jgi:hypothetical protein
MMPKRHLGLAVNVKLSQLPAPEVHRSEFTGLTCLNILDPEPYEAAQVETNETIPRLATRQGVFLSKGLLCLAP